MFIARQPIFDQTFRVYGYELLFRAREDATAYSETTPDKSTATVLGGLFELGLHQIVQEKKAFVNFDYQFLMSDAIELIEPKTLVIEVLEDIKVDEALLMRIRNLRKEGYMIALDDFTEDFNSYALVPVTNIIKFDIFLTPLDTIKQVVRQAKKQHKVLLAEKIETAEDYFKAKAMGFDLFQGYFFSKPKVVAGLHAKKTAQTIYHRIINELHQPEPSYKKLAEIIETDVNMAYRVLKLMHLRSAEGYCNTIKTALTKMGLQELERWVNVLMLQELAEDKPREIIRLSLARSKFGEIIAANSVYSFRKHEISLMCLFSVLDAMTDQSMETALEGLHLSDDVKNVLLHQEGPLKYIFELTECYETANWEAIERVSLQIHLDTEQLYKWYIESIGWADETMKLMYASGRA